MSSVDRYNCLFRWNKVEIAMQQMSPGEPAGSGILLMSTFCADVYIVCWMCLLRRRSFGHISTKFFPHSTAATRRIWWRHRFLVSTSWRHRTSRHLRFPCTTYVSRSCLCSNPENGRSVPSVMIVLTVTDKVRSNFLLWLLFSSDWSFRPFCCLVV